MIKLKSTNQNKYFNKEVIITKEKGENIILGGGDGSGRSQILLDILYELIETNQVDKSIFFNFLGDNSFSYRIYSIFEHLNENPEEKMLFLNSISENAMSEFRSFDFKDSKTQDYLKDKHLVFSTPALEKTPLKIYDEVFELFYDFLSNLPINNGKEIPIIIDHLSVLNYQNFLMYSDLMKKVNDKGYFFISSTYGMFNIHSFDTVFPLLMKDHKHFFIAHSQVNLENKFIKNSNFSKSIKKLNIGHFHYLKDFKLKHKSLKINYHGGEVKYVQEICFKKTQKDILDDINQK